MGGKPKAERLIFQCEVCGNSFSLIPWEARQRTTRFCSRRCAHQSVISRDDYKIKMRELALAKGFGGHYKGKKLSDKHRKKMSDSRRGKHVGGWKLSLETRKKMSEAHKGEKSPLWRGGITKVSAMIRCSFEYNEWRKSVFERDGYKCVFCGDGGRLHADHIKPFAKYPELRFEIDNGRTLCISCHKSTPTYLKR